MLNYDFIYHSNKIEGSTFTTDALQMLIEKEYRNSKFILHI